MTTHICGGVALLPSPRRIELDLSCSVVQPLRSRVSVASVCVFVMHHSLMHACMHARMCRRSSRNDKTKRETERRSEAESFIRIDRERAIFNSRIRLGNYTPSHSDDRWNSRQVQRHEDNRTPLVREPMNESFRSRAEAATTTRILVTADSLPLFSRGDYRQHVVSRRRPFISKNAETRSDVSFTTRADGIRP